MKTVMPQRVVNSTDQVGTVLRATQIRKPEQLYSLLHNFPSLRELGFDLPKMSSQALRTSSSGFRAVSDALDQEPKIAPLFGANPPPGAPAPPGFTVPLPPIPPEGFGPEGGGPLQKSYSVDLRMKEWPVRDQKARGTCVAHAIVACREHLAFQQGEDPQRFDLSEQFLFWATKTGSDDRSPGKDGTWVRFARQALEKHGVCQENLWPYNGTLRPGDVTHAGSGIPTPEALANAKKFCHSTTKYSEGGTSAGLLELLVNTQRPVAISLPVFADSTSHELTNWNTPVGIAYGEVLDPPPTSVATAGHAVCVIGFVPDEEELMGGYFIIRNSWGTQKFGRDAPTLDWHTPESGYGQVSATYIENYLWELCVL